MKLRTLELFCGIGAASKALKNIGIEEEIVDAVDIDKYAIKSFNAIHGTNFETQDITEWDKDVKDIDLIVHGSPCQDFSIAGKQQGGDLGSGTRSSLMYETVRIIGKTRPKYVLWENVKNVLSVRHKHNFDNYINAMEMLGYKSYYQVLNAKDYGIPQNRDRVYTISIRNDIANKFEFPNKEILSKSLQEMLEKDVSEKYFVSEKGKQYILKRVGNYTQLIYKDTIIAHCPITALGNANWTGNFVVFEFPPKEELKVKLKDILEEDVDEKYYLSEKMIDRIKNSNFSQEKTRIQQKDICDTLLARDFKDPKCVEVIRKYGIFDEGNSKHQAGSVYDKDGLCPTLDTMQGGWRQPCIEECYNDLAIRKLTPLECWRLMGFDDEDFYKAKAVPTSDTQLYKQAGNSIVVKVLEKIFLNLFKGEK